MKALLNRALNFAVLPQKLDITEILVDFNRSAGAATWQEYWFGKEKNEPQIKTIFKSQKINLPKNHPTPVGLKVMLSSIRSEILDPMNRNKEDPNLPKEEMKALKQLIILQKERVIIIKAADKGAGIVILNFKDYMKTCYDHLLSIQPKKHIEEEQELYYKRICFRRS